MNTPNLVPGNYPTAEHMFDNDICNDHVDCHLVTLNNESAIARSKAGMNL